MAAQAPDPGYVFCSPGKRSATGDNSWMAAQVPDPGYVFCSPGKRSATGDNSRMAAQAPDPGYVFCSPGKRSATGDNSRMAAQAPDPGYVFHTSREGRGAGTRPHPSFLSPHQADMRCHNPPAIGKLHPGLHLAAYSFTVLARKLRARDRHILTVGGDRGVTQQPVQPG